MQFVLVMKESTSLIKELHVDIPTVSLQLLAQKNNGRFSVADCTTFVDVCKRLGICKATSPKKLAMKKPEMAIHIKLVDAKPFEN